MRVLSSSIYAECSTGAGRGRLEGATGGDEARGRRRNETNGSARVRSAEAASLAILPWSSTHRGRPSVFLWLLEVTGLAVVLEKNPSSPRSSPVLNVPPLPAALQITFCKRLEAISPSPLYMLLRRTLSVWHVQ